MRYSGIQPQYFPRVHYFARMLNTDVFVLRDDCQFVRKHKYPNGKIGPSYQAHTPIKQTNGLNFLMSHMQHEGLLSLAKTRLSYQNDWTDTTQRTLKYVYHDAPNFTPLLPEIKMVFAAKYTYVADLNIASTCWAILRLLGHENISKDLLSLEYVNKELEKQKKYRLKKIERATLLNAFSSIDTMTPNEKILGIIKELGADEDYCGGTAIAAYMDSKLFEQNGIKITIQDWICNEYPQQYMKNGFIPNLSIIDLLMNVTPSQAADIIRG